MSNKDKKYSDKDLSIYDGGFTKSEDVLNAENKKTNAENAVANYGDYAKSDEVINAEKKKNESANAVTNYGDFSYSNQGIYDDTINKILNREKFSYDLNGDALYQQYKDKYIQQGKMAMQDAMGQAAAMTGGYGNSYAASVGNQAYQAQLNNLNDVIPELYQLAYDKYIQEGQDLYNQYGMLSDDRNTQYGMWGDKYNRLVSDRDYHTNEANNAYAKDYGQWSDKRNHLVTDRDYHTNEANNAYAKGYGEWSDQRDYDTNQYWAENEFGYGQERDTKADIQWDMTFNEGVRQFDETQKESARQHDNSINVRREEINNGQALGGDFTYTNNETTMNWIKSLPSQDEFASTDGGYEYNGVKYKDWEAFIDAKISDAVENGDLTEDEAASIIVDLGLS